ncbi:MAG: hypothetical protein CFE39_08210 [Comamonadaceae bacterium PBBC2]|nr:MAG: hypothetical protein CFE39_08210 [Comamonadaceae bacterium PBBC2]
MIVSHCVVLVLLKMQWKPVRQLKALAVGLWVCLRHFCHRLRLLELYQLGWQMLSQSIAEKKLKYLLILI